MQKRKRNCSGTSKTWELGLENIIKQCQWFEKRAWRIEGRMEWIQETNFRWDFLTEIRYYRQKSWISIQSWKDQRYKKRDKRYNSGAGAQKRDVTVSHKLMGKNAKGYQ